MKKTEYCWTSSVIALTISLMNHIYDQIYLLPIWQNKVPIWWLHSKIFIIFYFISPQLCQSVAVTFNFAPTTSLKIHTQCPVSEAAVESHKQYNPCLFISFFLLFNLLVIIDRSNVMYLYLIIFKTDSTKQWLFETWYRTNNFLPWYRTKNFNFLFPGNFTQLVVNNAMIHIYCSL